MVQGQGRGDASSVTEVGSSGFAGAGRLWAWPQIRRPRVAVRGEAAGKEGGGGETRPVRVLKAARGRRPAQRANMKSLLLVVLALGVAGAEEPSALEDCLRKDSIQCVQLTAFRGLKSFFDQDSVALFGGLSLVRDAAAPGVARSADLGQQVEAASDVESREEALEAFAMGEASAFLQERSLRFDFQPLLRAGARTLAESIPETVRNKVTEFMTEGETQLSITLKCPD